MAVYVCSVLYQVYEGNKNVVLEAVPIYDNYFTDDELNDGGLLLDFYREFSVD